MAACKTRRVRVLRGATANHSQAARCGVIPTPVPAAVSLALRSPVNAYRGCAGIDGINAEIHVAPARLCRVAFRPGHWLHLANAERDMGGLIPGPRNVPVGGRPDAHQQELIGLTA